MTAGPEASPVLRTAVPLCQAGLGLLRAQPQAGLLSRGPPSERLAGAQGPSPGPSMWPGVCQTLVPLHTHGHAHTSPHTEPLAVRETRPTLMSLSPHICFSPSLGARALFIFLAWLLRALTFRRQRDHSAPPFYEVYQTAKYPVSLSNGSGVNVPTALLFPRRSHAPLPVRTPQSPGLASGGCRGGPPQSRCRALRLPSGETEPHEVHTCTRYVHTPPTGLGLPRQTHQPPLPLQHPGRRGALPAKQGLLLRSSPSPPSRSWGPLWREPPPL